MQIFSSHTIHGKVQKTLLLCLTACLILSLGALNIMVKTCNHQLLLKQEDICRYLSHLLENSMKRVESLSMEIFQNTQVQESLTMIAQESMAAHLIQTQRELANTVRSLSFNRPSYVHLIALLDQQRSIHSYGSILLIEPFREQLYKLMDSDPKDGSISWRIIDGEKHTLMLCRTIRKAKLVTLEPIGFLALLVNTQEMLNSADILRDGCEECILVYLNNQLLYRGSLVTDEMLAELQTPKEGYTIQQLAGSRYFVTFFQPSSDRLSFVTLSSYDQITYVLRRTQIAIVLVVMLILIAIIITGTQLSNRIFKRLNLLTTIIRDTRSNDFLAKFDDSLLTKQDEVGMLAQNFRALLCEIDHLVNRNLRKELLITQAHVKMLQAQINPHFLYNTLDSITTLAQTSHDRRIAEMTIALARFMRASFQWDNFVSLDDEVMLVQEYLKIYRIRYENRLDAIIDYQVEDGDLLIPKMILQPLVENAVKYGLEKKVGVCRIRVRIRRRGPQLSIAVWDNGVGFPKEQAAAFEHPENFTQKDVHGLYNVAQRLHFTYGDSMRIRIRSRENCWSNISVIIPAALPMAVKEVPSDEETADCG
ncbi:MAG: sensor histidine kinase [Christensenellales bacterium]|jgi:two-component system sensor histidine kinase YesM